MHSLAACVEMLLFNHDYPSEDTGYELIMITNPVDGAVVHCDLLGRPFGTTVRSSIGLQELDGFRKVPAHFVLVGLGLVRFDIYAERGEGSLRFEE